MPYDRTSGAQSLPPGAPTDYAEVRRRRAEKSQSVMRAFADAGVKFLAASGTDAFGVLPGWGEHLEIKLLADAGLTPRQALAAATENYASLYGWRDVGRLAPGYQADLLVLDADPTSDVANLQRISAVYLSGQALDRQALLAWRPGSNQVR